MACASSRTDARPDPAAPFPPTRSGSSPVATPGSRNTPGHLRRRLAAIGIECRAQRTTALLQLAAQVPAAILGDTLGLTPRTAVHWTAQGAGRWNAYAARRT